MAGEHAIEVKALRKSYGKTEVLKGIDLQVKRGSLVALLFFNADGFTIHVNPLFVDLTDNDTD